MSNAGILTGAKLSAAVRGSGASPELLDLIEHLAAQCIKISGQLRYSGVGALGSKNAFGDEQLTVDMLAEESLTRMANDVKTVRAFASEENPSLKETNPGGRYVLCWDPLDGSSIVDCNWAVGTIVGVWGCKDEKGNVQSTSEHEGRKEINWKGEHTLHGTTGRAQLCSLICIYGPRTTLLLAVHDSIFDFTLSSASGEEASGSPGTSSAPSLCCPMISADNFLLQKTPVIASAGAKIFAPANLRASQDLPAYKELIEDWMAKRYTLRYSGGLVPDVYQMFVKGQGIFCNPASAKAPAKLRLCYEVAPIANLIEAAGGKTSSGKESLLDVAIEHMDQRSPFIGGTAEEVDKILACLNKHQL
eukprot:GHVT01002662.1.p1 GENE.GHVT01002662.1~~GHVT01002662.1.p1  ORF type:complete len:361 (+),score=82.51 GHVT01002662.1:251-1333(+)